MKFSNELIEKAKTAKSAEELLQIAKAENIEMTAEEASKYCAELHKTGELSDDELDNVAGGCGSGEVLKFDVVHSVYVGATNAAAKILENLGKKGDLFPEYKYKIEVHDTGIFTLERWEHELKSSYIGDD